MTVEKYLLYRDDPDEVLRFMVVSKTHLIKIPCTEQAVRCTTLVRRVQDWHDTTAVCGRSMVSVACHGLCVPVSVCLVAGQGRHLHARSAHGVWSDR